ncbi:MAG: hypothetical protein AAF526_08485 [Pseudomonadota bacterium]
MKSPLTNFGFEKLPGIGHNLGPPLERGASFRKFAWAKARRELLPRLPLEVLKRRVARAKELGLAYPQYASILLGTGRDVVAFLFTSDAIGLRVERTMRLSGEAAQKLGEIGGADRLLFVPVGIDIASVTAELSCRHGIEITHAGPEPVQKATRRQGGHAVRALLDPLKLPGDTVVMIGTEPRERGWADAARLAKFLPAEGFFDDPG